MGAGDQVTPAHFDNSENILCMVAGRKKLRLYHPSMSPFLYAEVQNRYQLCCFYITNKTETKLNTNSSKAAYIQHKTYSTRNRYTDRKMDSWKADGQTDLHTQLLTSRQACRLADSKSLRQTGRT